MFEALTKALFMLTAHATGLRLNVCNKLIMLSCENWKQRTVRYLEVHVSVQLVNA